jgi:hypothetical protein
MCLSFLSQLASTIVSGTASGATSMGGLSDRTLVLSLSFVMAKMSFKYLYILFSIRKLAIFSLKPVYMLNFECIV